MGRLPRLFLTIFERTWVAGHQSLPRDHLAYCDLATDRQQPSLTVSRVERRPQPSPMHCVLFPKSPNHRWRLGVGVPYGCHHPPKREDEHGRQGPQGQVLAQLEGPL